MAVDRLNDINAQQHSIDIDPSLQVQDGDMGEFLNEISQIKQNCAILDEKINQVQGCHDKCLHSNSNDAEGKKDKLEMEIKVIIQSIKEMLKNISSIKTSQEFKSIRNAQYSTVKTELMNLIEKYQKIENRYRVLYKGKLKNQYRIVNPNIGDEELNAIIDDEKAINIFAENILSETRAQKGKNKYDAVYQRHLDIKNFIKKIEELNELFEELQYIIDEQNEALDMATDRVEKVAENLKGTNEVLETGIDNAEKTRRNKMIYIILIVASVLLVLAILAIVFKTIGPASATPVRIEKTD